MCYSARIKANLRDLSREFTAPVDIASFEALFQLRLKDPSIKVPRALDRYFVLSKDSEEAALAPLIEKFYEEEKLRLQQEVRTTEEEIHELSAGKVTAAVRKKIETREKKRERLIGKQGQGILDISPLDERIYPFYYAPVIAEGKSGRRLVPMRYRVRRPDGGEVPGQYNVFNARIDSLESAKTWKPLFGKNHAIFPFRLFYEWVERDGGKREISFSPEDRSLMWAASIFIYTASPSGPLLSFAMVTDDPPPEVSAAGHDRCPVFLKQSEIGGWLKPADKSLESLYSLLRNKEKTFYNSELSA
jgi:putative SOS response-associated peptidase YedK